MTALSLGIGTQEHHQHNIPNSNQSTKIAFNLGIGNLLSLPRGNANAVANEVNLNARAGYGKNAVIDRNVNAGAGVNDATINHQFGQGDLGTRNEQRNSGYGRRAGGRPRKNPDSEKNWLRMIRNRESAARSTARNSFAWAQEAQQRIEIMNLKKENELLKGVTRFLLAAVRMEKFRTPTLLRSFSAPMLFNRSNF